MKKPFDKSKSPPPVGRAENQANSSIDFGQSGWTSALPHDLAEPSYAA